MNVPRAMMPLMQMVSAVRRASGVGAASVDLVRWLFGVGLFLLLLGAVGAQQLRPVPALSARVVDQTRTLDASQTARIEAQLEAIEQRKGSQVVVLMVPTTAPESIEQYSIRVAEAWKIGRGRVDGQAVDDGVILLIAKNDRRMRLEVGYGLEGAIPDALARRIIDEVLTPHFRQNDFAGGIEGAVQVLGKLIDGESLPAPRQPGTGANESPDWLGLALMVLVGGLMATAIFGRVLGSMVGGAGAGLLANGAGIAPLFAGGIGVAVFIFLLAFAASGRGLDALGRGGSGPVIMLPPGGMGGGRRRGGFGGGRGGGFGGGRGGGFGGGGASGGW